MRGSVQQQNNMQCAAYRMYAGTILAYGNPPRTEAQLRKE